MKRLMYLQLCDVFKNEVFAEAKEDYALFRRKEGCKVERIEYSRGKAPQEYIHKKRKKKGKGKEIEMTDS